MSNWKIPPFSIAGNFKVCLLPSSLSSPIYANVKNLGHIYKGLIYRLSLANRRKNHVNLPDTTLESIVMKNENLGAYSMKEKREREV